MPLAPALLWRETAPDPDLVATGMPAAQQVSLLRHPAQPVADMLPRPAGAGPDWLPDAAAVLHLARRYVDLIAADAGLPPDLVDVLGTAARRPASGGVGWLPLAWGHGPAGGPLPADADPRGSHWVVRRDDQGRLLDASAVLLAARQVAVPGQAQPATLGGDVGLRVVAHVDPAPDGSNALRLRIAGCSLSRLASPGASGPLSDRLQQVLGLDGAPSALANLAAALGLDTAAPDEAGLPQPALVLLSLRTGAALPPGVARVLGEGWRRGQRHAFEADLDADGRLRQRLWLRRQASHARRPRVRPRAARALAQGWADSPRQRTLDSIDLQGLQPEPDQATDKAPQDERPASLSQPLSSTDDPQALHAALLGARFSAIAQRLQDWRLPEDAWARRIRLPLQLMASASVGGQRDAVNAEVRLAMASLPGWGPWQVAGSAPAGGGEAAMHDLRPALQWRMGAADTSNRLALQGQCGRLRDIQPVGLSIDPSWVWHEFGHVLAYASIGALELRFAHSLGDALAAVAQDPAHPWADDPDRPDDWRGRTFAVVPLGRRHDRQAALGWCWCGRRNLLRLGSDQAQADRRLGYFGEELLSSSLFRLYRCLGGDTLGASHWAVRRGASEYVLYLAARALSLLGPDTIVPARTADHLVSALIDADLGSSRWQLDITHDDLATTWLGHQRPAGQAPQARVQRQGGQLHKLLRWVFEQQGLYGPQAPDCADGPGLPPPVDVYIADARHPQATPDGGYSPVPLVAEGTHLPWQAHPEALAWRSGLITVQLGQRGSQPAAPTPEVRAWAWHADPQAAAGGAWQLLTSATSVWAAAPQAAPLPGTSHGAAWQPPAGRAPGWWVLVAAEAAGDPSLLADLPDAATGLPPPGSAALRDLVAVDNNLALAWLPAA